MPSPFPGMDPYLEDPAIWPDFHSRFADEISAVLKAILPRPYYAQLEMRTEVGIVGDDEFGRRIVPDVTIQRHRQLQSRHSAPGPAVAEPRSEPSESFRVELPDEQVRHHYVEIRDANRGHALVTLIEIVSPANKRRGPDRKAYERKQREVLDSDASLIEVDLISSGEPVVGTPLLIDLLEQAGRRSRYLVTVSRAWRRYAEAEYEVFAFGLAEPLPCISVPLREREEEVLLDLQYVFQQAYDRGPYDRGAVDYKASPTVPLSDDEREWVSDQVAVAFPELRGDRS